MHPSGHRRTAADRLFSVLTAHATPAAPLEQTPPSSPLVRAPDDDLLTEGGATLGGVHLLSLIGEGAMGRVYLGHHQTLDIEVAVKVMRQGKRPQAERFVNEARLAARTQHANIVRTLHAGYEGSRLFLVQEYVAGINLKQLLRRSGPLPWTQAVHFAMQAARGLGAAHEAGIIHRDIKPSNLLITPHSTLKIVDLGLACTALQGQEWIGAASILGTPAYMAPEQARDFRKAGPRADVYALGITLYHMLSGNVPFKRASHTSMLLAHIHEPIPDIRTAVGSLPPPLVLLLERMLAKDPSTRPADGDELVRELEQISQSSGHSSGQRSATPPLRYPVAAFPHGLLRRKAVVAAAAGVGALAVLMLALSLTRPGWLRQPPAGDLAAQGDAQRLAAGALAEGRGRDRGSRGGEPALADDRGPGEPWQTPERALVVHCVDVPADIVVAVHAAMIASGLPVIDRDLIPALQPAWHPQAGSQDEALPAIPDARLAEGLALDLATIGQRVEVRAALFGSGEIASDELVEPSQAAAAVARAIAAGTALMPERGWLLAHADREFSISLGSRHGAHVGDRFAVRGGDAQHPGEVVGFATITACDHDDARVQLETPRQAVHAPALVSRLAQPTAAPSGAGSALPER
jgi:hypothetical protein